MKRILVTGFEPFQGEKINPSQILLEHLKRDLVVEDLKIDTIVLPVSFSNSYPTLQAKLAENSYDFVLLLGQAGSRSTVCLERVALNWIETFSPDEDGYRPRQGKILDLDEAAIFSPLPLGVWRDRLQAQGHPVTVSLSAGGYVCNYIYYQVCQAFRALGNKTPVLFVHVPYLPEQAATKAAGTPSLELSTMKASIIEILKIIFSEPNEVSARLKD